MMGDGAGERAETGGVLEPALPHRGEDPGQGFLSGLFCGFGIGESVQAHQAEPGPESYQGVGVELAG